MIDGSVMRTIEKAEQFQRDRSDSWNIPREQGLLMHQIALAGACRHIVEVGTSYGYSGLFLAAAAKANDGTLHTFERNPDKIVRSAEFFADAGLTDSVKQYNGDALDRMSELPDDIHYAFLDATKDETADYWRIIEPKLAGRCVIVVDNTSTHPEQLGEFVRMLRGRDDFSSCDVQVGHGFELAVRCG